jgi:hypothetical protein
MAGTKCGYDVVQPRTAHIFSFSLLTLTFTRTFMASSGKLFGKKHYAQGQVKKAICKNPDCKVQRNAGGGR